MQSTGQTDTHETSSTSMHGSAITYVIQFLLDQQARPDQSARTTRVPPGGGAPGERPGREGAGLCHPASGTPSSPTQRTGTAIPFSKWPGIRQATTKPRCDGPSAGTVHVTS